MTRLRITHPARHDLVAVYCHGVEMFGLAQSDAYIAGLLDLFDQIIELPRAGRLIGHIQPPIRVLAYKAHIVVYEEQSGNVDILRVRSAREDWSLDPQGISQ